MYALIVLCMALCGPGTEPKSVLLYRTQSACEKQAAELRSALKLTTHIVCIPAYLTEEK